MNDAEYDGLKARIRELEAENGRLNAALDQQEKYHVSRIIALETELAFAVSGYEDRIAALEAVLRCCLADPRIPTGLWCIIELALATAETEVKP